MTDVFDQINTGNLGLHILWLALTLWLVLTVIVWAGLNFFRTTGHKTKLANFRTALLVASPVTVTVVGGLLFIGSESKTPAAQHSSSVSALTSPVILAVDTTGAPSFKCVHTEPGLYSDTAAHNVILQFDPQQKDVFKSVRIIKGMHETINQQALRCFRQVRFTESSGRQDTLLNYAVPVEYRNLPQEWADFDTSEGTPAFMETDKLPGKDLALRFNALEEPGTISGKLLHGDPKKPLPNADIVLQGTKFWTVTDGEGEFYLSNLPSGVQQFEVNYLGHTIGRMQITIN